MLKLSKLTGEQVLAALCMLLITMLSIVGMLIVATHPDATAVVVAFAAGTVTALASLVRRHDIQDPAPSSSP